MRIAFLISTLRRTETFVLSQIQALLALGHEVDVVTRVHAADDDAVGSLGGRCRALPPRAPTRLRRAIAGCGLAIRQAHRHPGAVATTLDTARFGRYALSFDLLQFATPFLDGPHYDVVHCHFGPSGVFGAMLLEAGVLQCPLVVTFYGHDVTRYPRQHGPGVYRRLFERADLVLALDPTMAARLRRLGADPARLDIHPLGVDLDRFRAGPPPPAPPLRLLSVGRHVEKKGFEYAIRAVAALRADGLDVVYRVGGDGPRRRAARHLAVELGVDDRVEFPGRVDHRDVPALLAATHALVAPSVEAADGDQEGTPTVIIEAMACGRPVVATRHAGIPFLLADGEAGLLAPERNVSAIAAAIARLADPGTRTKYGRSGQERARSTFGAAPLARRLVDRYARLLRAGEPGPAFLETP